MFRSFARTAGKRIRAILEFSTKELASQDCLCGSEFSAADIVVGYNLFIIKYFELAPQGFQVVEGYYKRLSSPSAFQNAIAD